MFLADGEVAWGKLIPFGIFLLIWIVGAIASGIKKAGQQMARPRPLPPLPAERTNGGNPSAPPIQSDPSIQSALAWQRQAIRQKQALLEQRRAQSQRDPGAPAIVQQAEALAALMNGLPRVSAPAPASMRRQTARRAAVAKVVVPEPAPEIVSADPASLLDPSELMDAATPAATPSGPTATAPAISKWLKPQTLRQQFILTEIFQTPLALRPDRDF